jgi:4-carboxymuconolactone decarboxylase
VETGHTRRRTLIDSRGDATNEPRLTPLPSDEQDDATRLLLQQLAGPDGSSVPNLYSTLARNTPLFRRWLAFGSALLNGCLPPRSRELLILRIAWHCRSAYEFGQHVLISQAVGLSPEDIARLTAAGSDMADWDPRDAAVLLAADELHHTATWSQPVWSTLREHFDDAQIIELLMVAGQYHLVAFCANALAIELDEGLPGLPD